MFISISSGTLETRGLLGLHSLYPTPLGSESLHISLACLLDPPGWHPAWLLRDAFLPPSTMLPTAPWKHSCALMCMGEGGVVSFTTPLPWSPGGVWAPAASPS